MSQELNFGESKEIRGRESLLIEFLERLFDEEDRPFFVSDEACLYDLYAGDDAELSQRCEHWYGRKLHQADFQMPVWKLIDELYQ